MVCEDPVLLLSGVVHSCQCKECPLAGMQSLEVLPAVLPQLLLQRALIGQHVSLGSAFLDPRHDQLIHQLQQALMLPASLSQELQHASAQHQCAVWTAWQARISLHAVCCSTFQVKLQSAYLAVQHFIGRHMRVLPASAVLSIFLHKQVPSILHGE